MKRRKRSGKDEGPQGEPAEAEPRRPELPLLLTPGELRLLMEMDPEDEGRREEPGS